MQVWPPAASNSCNHARPLVKTVTTLQELINQLFPQEESNEDNYFSSASCYCYVRFRRY